jgi:hypothetical protein
MSNQEALAAVEQELAATLENRTETKGTISRLFESHTAPPPTIRRVGGFIGGVKDECNVQALLQLG